MNYFLVLDIGTTGVKALVFDESLKIRSRVYKKLKKSFPKKDWVEQSPLEIVRVSEELLKQAIKKSRVKKSEIKGLGITNQRETTILWDKSTGKPVYPAIVWEDQRTKAYCEKIKKLRGSLIRQKTGLPTDSYFSASKIHWILGNIPLAEKTLKNHNLLFGTVDSWLVWNLTSEKNHLTDYTNSSRTLLFDIREFEWDNSLLKIFGVPSEILPAAKPSVSFFGNLDKKILGFQLPVITVCGDQQASLYAAGNGKGVTKVTYGTGAFIMQDLSDNFLRHNHFFTTLTPADMNSASYALEAKVEGCGTIVTPLLKKPEELRKAILKIVRAVDAYLKKLPIKPEEVIIDGGVTRYKNLASLQSEVSKIKIRKQDIFDGTSLGIVKLMKTYKK